MESTSSLLIIIILLTIVWYLYTKYKEYEKKNYQLQSHFDKLTMENSNYRTRIKDLQKYKNDVSKTFKILDTELTNINNHVEKGNSYFQMHGHNNITPQNNNVNNIRLNQSGFDISSPNTNRINLLTPDMLNNLIENMNQEFTLFQPSSYNYTQHANEQQQQQQQQQQHINEQQQQHINEQQQQHINEQQQQHINEQQQYINEQQQQHINEQEQHINEQQQQHINEQESMRDRFLNTVSTNINSSLGSTILRSMSFPNLPSAYQRLMIPISESTSGNN